MAEKGIGARVVRKEDQRFITGRGHYTDDINQPGQTYACFVRSPHAHARIKGINKASATGLPGVLAVLTGEDVAADKLGNLVCGWLVKSKDGSPMKMGPHPLLAQGKARYVGDRVAVVVAETYAQAKDAAEALEVDYEELPAVVALGDAHDASALVHDEVANNLIYDWELGDKAATDAAFAKAAHVTRMDLVNNRLVPNAMEPRAATGHYDSGMEAYTLYVTSQNPHVARLVISAFVGVAPEHKLRVIAPDVGGGFGSKIFIYGEECVVLWASKKIGGRPVKWTAERSESFLSDCHGRDHVSHAELALDEAGNFLAMRVNTKANLGAYMSTFSSCVPTYLYATLLAGQYKAPAIYCDVQAYYTNTAPVDAYRGAGRPEASFLIETLVEQAAHEIGKDPAEFRRQNFIPKTAFPYQTPVALHVRHGRLRGDAGCRAQARRLCGLRAAPGAVREPGQAPRHRHLLLHRGLRHRPLGGGRLPGRRRRPLGERQGPLQPYRQGAGPDRHAQPRAGPRDDVQPAHRGEARRALRGRRRDPRRHGEDAGRHGHLWLPLAGGRRRGDREVL